MLDSGSAATGLNVGMSLSIEDRASQGNDTLAFTISSGVSPFFPERIGRFFSNIDEDVFPAADWGMVSTTYENGRAGNDDAAFDLVALRSRDSGRTWIEERTLVTPGPGDTSVYHPGLLRLRGGEILLRYEIYHRFVKGQPPLVDLGAAQ